MNDYSDSLEVPCGTPQDSVLGPPLFNINLRSQPQYLSNVSSAHHLLLMTQMEDERSR